MEPKREIIRSLVQRIEIGRVGIAIIFRLPRIAVPNGDIVTGVKSPWNAMLSHTSTL